MSPLLQLLEKSHLLLVKRHSFLLHLMSPKMDIRDMCNVLQPPVREPPKTTPIATQLQAVELCELGNVPQPRVRDVATVLQVQGGVLRELGNMPVPCP